MLELRFIVERKLPQAVIQGQLSLKEAAASFKLSRQSAAKWVARFRPVSPGRVPDRTSRPRHSPRLINPPLVERVVCFTGVDTDRRAHRPGHRLRAALL